MKYCEIYIEERFLYNQTLTYSCENESVFFGSRVWVKVRSRRMIGFVARVYEADPMSFDYKILPIEAVVDEKPVINEEMYRLAQHMSYTTVSPMIACLQAILPNKLRPKSTSKGAKMEKGIQFTGFIPDKLTPKQLSFIETFKNHDFIYLKDAQKNYSGFRKLVELKAFEIIEREVRYAETEIDITYHPHNLTNDQQNAVNQVEFNQAHTYLVHGVTGSGKTEVYLNLAEKVLKQGKSVVFLVPEISLTPQMIERVAARFGKDVVIYHSRLNDQEKYEQYLRVKNNEMKIVVGTRSAIFLPFKDLGLIIMDEEHDSSYKQDNIPAYHTLDIAQYRSQYHQCPLVLGSASPRLETYARALRSVYTLIELPVRINESFPKVTLVDTQKELYKGNSSVLTPQLLEQIDLRLQRNEQTVLLLNRRGYTTYLKDQQSNQVLMCPNCDISLSYHKHDRSLKCHVCDYITHQIPKGSEGQNLEVVGYGVGTQRLVEELERRYPHAGVLRVDRDSTQTKNAHERLLNDFRDGKYQILVGTQMIAKGLDIANVTLVGILNIDADLAHEDYRSAENAFDLILQATGRSGRGDKNGEVVIQTFNPDHYAIIYGSSNQYKKFFNQEMQYRKVAQYPPYSYLISLTFSDVDEQKSYQSAQKYLELFDAKDMKVMGPSILKKIANVYRSRIILKGKNLDQMLVQVHNAMDLYYRVEKGGVRVDVNPLTLM